MDRRKCSDPKEGLEPGPAPVSGSSSSAVARNPVALDPVAVLSVPARPWGWLPRLSSLPSKPMSTDTLPVDQSPAATATADAAVPEVASETGAAELDPRALTLANVERALDELRPYLMADGGNVEVVEIDGPIVKVRLQGACGSCPSSTMTLKMGIERKLREAIPEVDEVVQVL